MPVPTAPIPAGLVPNVTAPRFHHRCDLCILLEDIYHEFAVSRRLVGGYLLDAVCYILII